MRKNLVKLRFWDILCQILLSLVPESHSLNEALSRENKFTGVYSKYVDSYLNIAVENFSADKVSKFKQSGGALFIHFNILTADRLFANEVIKSDAVSSQLRCCILSEYFSHLVILSEITEDKWSRTLQYRHWFEKLRFFWDRDDSSCSVC